MAIDPYAACPCGSGKKLKFCCNDLAADIEKIHKMITGDQPHAALKHIEQLLVKQPERASLLDLCASIQLSLHDFEAAQSTVEKFLASNPTSATAHAQSAILISATKSGSEAIDALQTSLEHLTEEMPVRVLEAIGAVGHALLLEGQIVAARAHLLLYAAITPEENNLALELLLRMNLKSGLPLLMREYLLLEECPEGAAWQAEFDEAFNHSGSGRWRMALDGFTKLREENNAEPSLVYNSALLSGWLGDMKAFAAGLHEYAKLDVPANNASEAEALAQLTDPELVDPQMDTLKLVYKLEDCDELCEQLRVDNRVEDYPLEVPEQESDDFIRPRSSHVLLDRPTPSTGVGIERSDIPHVIAFLTVYGKRTDRDAQLEVTTDRDATLPQVQKLLAEISESKLGEPMEEEVVAQKSLSEESLSWRWRLPNDTPADQRRKLLSEQRREAILDQWTNAPRAALQDNTPLEAVGNPDLQVALQASALIIEQAAVDPEELPLFEELRDKLKVPKQETIDPTGCDMERFPLVRIPHVDLTKLSAETLQQLLNRSVLMGANFATLIVADALIEAAESDAGVDLASAYRQLIRFEPNYSKAQEWVAKAKAWSQGQGKSLAEWVLLELELSIERGDSESLRRALNEIQAKYTDEPGVAEATYRLLYSAGLISPDAMGAPAMAGAGAPPATQEPSGIWTPDGGGGEAAGSAEGDSQKSAIWTP